MVEMAKRGGGNHYYGDTAADLFNYLPRSSISSLTLRAPCPPVACRCAGVTVRLLNDYPVEGDAGIPVIRLPDIAFGAEAWALVELEIPAGLAAMVPLPCSRPPSRQPHRRAPRSPSSMQRWRWRPLHQRSGRHCSPDALVVARRAELDAGQAARTGPRRGRIWRLGGGRAHAQRGPAALRRPALGDPSAGKHGRNRPLDGYRPLPQGSPVCLQKDEFSGSRRRRNISMSLAAESPHPVSCAARPLRARRSSASPPETGKSKSYRSHQLRAIRIIAALGAAMTKGTVSR